MSAAEITVLQVPVTHISQTVASITAVSLTFTTVHYIIISVIKSDFTAAVSCIRIVQFLI